MPTMKYLIAQPLDLYHFASAHCEFWGIFCNPDFNVQHLFVRGKKQYLHQELMKESWNQKKSIKHLIKLLMDCAPEFVNDYHTCVNEAINS